MLVSGGKVLAIDKVNHNGTLTGDGCFEPLGVNDYIGKSDVENMFVENLKSYYTTAQIDEKFTALDSKYDPKGEAAAVKTWVEDNYETPEVLAGKYETIENVSSVSSTLSAAIDAVYTAGYVNVSALQSLGVANKQYSIFWKGDGTWTWAITEGGGGDNISGTNYVSAWLSEDGNVKWLGLDTTAQNILQTVTSNSGKWETKIIENRAEATGDSVYLLVQDVG